MQFRSEHRNQSRVAFIVFRQKVHPEQRVEQPLFVADPVLLLCVETSGVDNTGGEAGSDILAGPETGDGRQIMRRGGDQRLCRVLGGQLETGGVLFKDQQAVTQDAEAGEGFTNLVFHGAQIFPDDDAIVADAFESQNAHQVRRAVAHVGALRRGLPFGNPVETEEAHHVVDTERAPVTHGFADGFPEEAVAVFEMA